MLDPLPRVVDVMHRGLEDGLHIGAAIYVSVKGKEVAELVFAEAEPGRLLTHEASCPWLSAGKPQTAAAIAWLWERKLLKLDDPVVKFWPEFAQGDSAKSSITIRHCLTHMAGLRAAISAWTRQSEPEILETLADAKIETGWTVGKSAGYHVAATWYVLGKVIEVVSTKPAAEFLREMIWKPVGMTGTRLTFSDTEWDETAPRRMVMHDTSKSYIIRGAEGAPSAGTTAEASEENLQRNPPVPLTWEMRDTWKVSRPGSGIRGPIRDLGRFYEWMGGYAEPASNVLGVGTRAALSAKHRVGILDQTFRAKVDWGLGFVMESSHYGQGMVPYQFGPHASPRTFGHAGNQSSMGLCDPEHGLVVAFVFNGMCGDPRHDKRARETLAAVYEDLGLV